MTKRTIIEQLPANLKSDTGEEYPADIVRDAYMKSEQGIRGFCKRYGLNEATVEKFVRLGKWDELRAKYLDRMYKTFVKDMVEVMEWKQSLIHRLETLTLMEIEASIYDLERHVIKHGDTFVRNEEGEIIRDAFGNPIARRAPIGLNRVLKELHDLRNENAETLLKVVQEHPTLVPAKPIELPESDSIADQYSELLESRKNE